MAVTQLALFTTAADAAEQKCPHCHKPLVASAGRLLCANAYCPAAT